MVHEKDEAVIRIAERQRWGEDDARVVVKAWRRSGESLSQFARRCGVRGERVSWWVSRVDKPESNGLSFHRVRLLGAQNGRQQDRESIEVVLRDRRLVRVPHGSRPRTCNGC